MNYKEMISRYLNSEVKDFSEILSNYSYKNIILKKLKQYVKYYPESESEIDKIIANIDELMNIKMSKEKFSTYLYILAQKECETAYLKTAYDLLTLVENEAIELLRKKNMNDKEYDKFLSKFQNRFPSQTEEYDYLIDLYYKYLEKYNISTEKKDNVYIGNLGSTRPKKEVNLELFTNLYDSNLCIYEYCSKTGYQVQEIEEYLNSIESNYPECKLSIKTIKTRDKSQFMRYMVYVTYKLYHLEEYDFLDYLEYTKLNIKDFYDIIQEIHFDETMMRNLYKKLRQISPSKKWGNNYIYDINREEKLDSKTIINGRVVTREEKEKIFKFLDNNHYSTSLYNIALKKYLNGKLDLDNKVLTK